MKNKRQERYGKYHVELSSLISVMAFLVVGVGGCHPCSFVECPGEGIDIYKRAFHSVTAEAYIDGAGDIYIDIKEKNNFQRIEIIDISVNAVEKDRLGILYWAIREGMISAGKLENGAPQFPLKYGHDAPETIVVQYPKKIQEGIYEVSGYISAFSDRKKSQMTIVGRFRFEKGSVLNIRR